MALALRSLGRQSLLLRQQSLVLRRCVQPGSSEAYDEMKEFWDRNRKLNRPLSPHLSIYKPQLTSMLSLAHRATGIAMSVTVPIVAATLMFMPEDFTTYVNMIRDMNFGGATITGMKYFLAFPLVYHYINGIRHLAWDWAKGFSLSATYSSGKFVMLLALIVTAAVVHLL